jgi:transposase-like protein
MLAEGKTIPEVAETPEVSENTFHRWRAQYGGMKADDVLKELEPENSQLKRSWSTRSSRTSRCERWRKRASLHVGFDRGISRVGRQADYAAVT